MSYPFGFTTVFQGFYFRSIFVPIVLLIAAVYIAGYSRASGPASWLLSSMVLTLCGMPILYQFECNDNLPTTSCWGLVDNFLAGTAAVAIAFAQRSVTTLSPLCAIASALAAAFCLMIKPAGLLVMLVVGGSWLILIGFRIGWIQPDCGVSRACPLFGDWANGHSNDLCSHHQYRIVVKLFLSRELRRGLTCLGCASKRLFHFC